VADINVVMAGMDQTTNESYDDTGTYEDIANTPLADLAAEDGTFRTEIPPEDNIRMMRDIAHGATLHVPDHVMDCLYRGLEQEYKGTRHYHTAEQIADGITDFLNYYAEPLQVKDRMGVDRYTREALRDRHPRRNEDDFIVDATQDLDGDTVVMTYDDDYLDLPVTAATPPAVQHVLDDQ
jgi:hypothetical protein